MTDLSIQPRIAAFQPQPFDTAGKGNATNNPTATPVPMDAATLSSLTDAVAQRLLTPANDSGRTGTSAMPVELRAATITLEDAQASLTSIISKLPILLTALVGGNDPIKTDEGSHTRATEGAAAQIQPRAVHDSPATVASASAATGADADIGARSANAGAWIKDSPFGNLLALLRQLLLKFEKLDRDNSTQMVTLQRQITIVAGDLGVEKARESFGGAVAATILTGAVGGFALKKSFESTSMQTGSMDSNLRKANKTDIQVHDARGQVKAHGTTAENMRPARNVAGEPASARVDGGRASADLQADADVDVRSMNPSAAGQKGKSTENDRQRKHSEEMANAQNIAAKAVLGNMVAPSIGGIASATMNIEAEMTESERQLMLNVAETFKRVADEQQDQATKTRDMRDATAQLVDSLMNLMASTSSHQISKF
ncbi:hypothetical protein [Stenotrophomonas sp. PD6]|uniref:hypothetical protein n=1 Tax=Stenotrophomonas sp. PD6 TaxID=3368612 RepID=UPI003BA2E9FA